MAESAALPNWMAAAAGAAVLGGLLLAGGPASAQGDQPRSAEPNVFERIADWFDRSIAGIDDDVKDTVAGVKQFGSRAGDTLKDAAAEGAALASPRVRVITERRLCPSAANGAPDCQRAAQAACRSRGYAKGTSLQTESERKCALPPLFSQASVKCHTETHVLRALCQ